MLNDDLITVMCSGIESCREKLRIRGDRILQCEPITGIWSFKECSPAVLHSGIESCQLDLNYSDLFFVQNLPVQNTFWHRILHYELITAIYSGTDSPTAKLRSGRGSSSRTQLQWSVLAQNSRVRITSQKALCDGDGASLRDGGEEFGRRRSVRSSREFCRVSADVSSASVALESDL
jgi:hypothetical protein